MKISSILRDTVLMALAFTGLLILQSSLLKDALVVQERTGLNQLMTGISGMLNNAHKSKDDIAIYEVLHSLTQASGIVRARIIDPDVNAEPESDTHSQVLEDGTHQWGKLILSVSDYQRRKLLRRQWLAGLAASGLVWAILFVYVQFMEKKNHILSANLAELSDLLQTEKKKIIGSQERERKTLIQAAATLQEAVRRISQPVLVLDSQQRVAALSESALASLNVSGSEMVLQKSWLEVPVLGSCGAALERSLTSPGQEILWSIPDSEDKFRIKTELDGLSGTWVELISSHKE